MKLAIGSKMLVAALSLGLLASVGWAARPLEQVTPMPRCNNQAGVWRALEMPRDPQSGDIWLNPVDGSEMVYIGPGHFYQGNDQVADERPYHRMFLNGYWISRNTVTVAQFRKFCEITAHRMPPAPDARWLPESPIVNVDWNDAAAYAKWANGRLPNESEWEKAARGVRNVYPWGNAWDASKCNNGLAGKNAPVKVGSFPAGASDFGVMDMAGNVAQWCLDPYQKAGDVMEYRVIRGGSCHDTAAEAYRTSRRDYVPPATRVDIIGFRYVMSAR